MKSYTLCFLILWFFIVSYPAQDKQNPRSEEFDAPSVCELFENAAKPYGHTVIFKSIEQFSGSRTYNKLLLDESGNAYIVRVVPNLGLKDGQFAKLSFEQLQEVKRMLATSYFRTLRPNTKPKENEIFTAFVFHNGKGYSRFDYVGTLPQEIQKVIDFVKAELRKQHEQ